MTKDLSVLEAQLHNLLMQSKSALSEAGKLCEEIQRLKSKPKIDWSKMPEVLCEVRDFRDHEWVIAYFSHAMNGLYFCHTNGATAKTSDGTCGWDEIRLIENEPKPWFGGECPIPDGVRFKYWLFGRLGERECDIISKASSLRWNFNGTSGDIIAYQILVEE